MERIVNRQMVQEMIFSAMLDALTHDEEYRRSVAKNGAVGVDELYPDALLDALEEWGLIDEAYERGFIEDEED